MQGVVLTGPQGAYLIPWGTLFKKGVIVGMGRDRDKRYNDHLQP